MSDFTTSMSVRVAEGQITIQVNELTRRDVYILKTMELFAPDFRRDVDSFQRVAEQVVEVADAVLKEVDKNKDGYRNTY